MSRLLEVLFVFGRPIVRTLRTLIRPLLRLILTLLVLVMLAAAGLFIYARTLPGVDDLAARTRASIRQTGASYQPLSDIAPVMREAIVAVEDGRFYDHQGIDPIGIGRALYNDLRAGNADEGGSTIPQQLVKRLYFNGDDSTIKSKLDDVILAVEATQTYSKDTLLELYLNEIYFGHGAYGIQAAAQTYFQRDAANLTLGQAALLAGLPQAPSLLDPIEHPRAAAVRRREVLDVLVRVGITDAATADRIAASPLPSVAS